MTCPACAHENRPGAKFCEECAAPLKRACASCGCELRPSAKFCDECGTPATGAATTPRRAGPAGARKVVSIVFADLVGSTALHERLDPESARRFMESYYDAMRGAVESHGGTVTQLLGDGVKAVFGIPRVAEDDAIRAVRAAVAMQQSFRALAERQRGAVGQTGLRVAVNTGEVVANDAAEIIGDPVNVAARLQEQGRDGDVVIGDSTARLVAALVTLAPLGSFRLKGRAEPVAAFRVESLERPESAALAAFVGRDAEIARVTAVYDTAVEKPATCLAVLLGSPGLGKSRLIDEFASRLGETATVAVAQCDAAGGATFAPLAEALRERLGIDAGANADAIRAAIEATLPGDDAERSRVAGGVASLLAGSPAPPEETFFVVRRLLAALAATKPVVLVIDDIHWAEPLLLDLVEHLVQWGGGVPLFLLCGARPELRDMRSSLVTAGGLVSDVVTLAGLDAGAAMRLAANVIGAADLPAAVAAKVLAASEGNPLFVGELVRMLVHEGALKREGDRWTAGTALAALEMPPTIHALLAARIERLRPEERNVLERAAVVGRQFSRGAIAELLPRDVADLDARLESLRRSELIERDTGWFLGEPVLRFHHVLIRDAAYRGLLKGTRAELHERFADWATAKAGEAIEHDETIGWHLEQAHQLLRELGPIDAKGRALGERASRHLAAAGRRALARDDLPLAASLLGRALERLDADDAARADLALDWCEALLAAGDVGPAVAAIDQLARFGAASDRLRAWHTCFAGQHTVLTAPSALRATADAVAAAAESLDALGDAAGEAKGHFVHALALARLGEIGACEAALDLALAAARRAGDRRRANTVLAIAPLAALWGPSPVTRASGRCLDVVRVLRITQGAPAVEAVALSCQGVLEALRGRTDAARRMIASARKMVEELGITQRLLEADVFGGLVLLLEGDAPAAERNLRPAYAGLRNLGLGIDAARAAALLARALLAQGRVEEAEALSHESEALAGDDLKAAIAWRGVRAEALARRGEHAAAIELASKAVELAAATDALLDHADARLALAVALRAAGRDLEADAEEGRAAELWEAKGATLLAERRSPAAALVAPAVEAAAPQGTGRASGGAYERPFLSLFATDTEGRLARGEWFDDDREAEALARFDALTAEPATPRSSRRARPNSATHTGTLFEAAMASHEVDALARFEALVGGGRTIEPQGAFENAASRADRRLFEHFDARDWLAIEALAAPDLVFDERRRLLRNTCGREVWLEQFRVLFDVPASRFATKLLATRGERLSLNLHCFSGEVADGGGPLAMDDHFALHEVDGDGRIVAIVLFDQDDETEAHAELDARWQAGEGADRTPQMAFLRSFDAALARRDWDAVAANYAPAFVGTDHRLVGWGTLRGPAGFVEAFRTLVALAPDVRLRWDHLRTSGRGMLGSAVWLGTRDGGAFENPFLLVGECGADGRMLRADFYDVHHIDRAHARLAEIESAVAPHASRFANAATRHVEETVATWMAADWERFASLFPADARLSDRRRAVQLELGREELIAFSRSLGEHATTRIIHVETLATRGERLALQQWRVELAGDGAGSSEISYLTLMDRGEQGIQTVRWDDDAIDAAYADLAARFEAGEGAAHPHALAFDVATDAAIRSRDWDALAARCAPAFRMRDHRLLGWGTMVSDAATFVRVVRSAVELAPDANYRHDHVRICARGTLAGMVLCGTRDGGAFETPLLRVTEVDEQGRILSHDTYDESDYERALARFEEIRASERRDSLAAIATPNAASAAMDRWDAAYGVAFETGDWEPMRALCAPDLVFEDRRRLALLSGDRDFMIASARERVAIGARPQRRVRGTAGDRVVIGTILWSGGPPGGRFEIEYIGVIEVDESGLVAGMVMFDSDDARAAQREAWARWAAIDPTVAPWVDLLNDLTDAWNAHDVARVRARFADDVVVEDHRLAGLGRIDRADAYVEANAVLWDLAPDQRIEFSSSWLAWGRHGLVASLRRFGTLPEGGDFESEYLFLTLVARGRITHIEMFEMSALDVALARFEELRPDPLRVPPNAAARAVRRIAPLYSNADLPALRAIVSDDFVFDDRTRGSLLRGGVEEWVSGLRFLRTETRARLDARLVATAGDRLALNRLSWQETPGESSFLIERFGLYEIDATGKLLAFVLFDADDRAAAHEELFERYVALGADGMPACLVEFKRALDARDLDRVRVVLADDFVYHDRRRTGSGRLDGPDAYLASPRAWWEARIEMLYSVAVAPHGRVAVNRMAGRNVEGGDFESFMVTLLWTRGERLAGAELFEIDHLDAALTRLEDLRPDPLRPPLTAATGMRDRHRDAFVARDWDAVRALTGAGFVFDDRGKRALVRGDVEAWIASLEFTSQPGFRIESAIIGTLGDRIVVDQLRWFGKPDGDAFEFERVRLLDVGADGLLRAVVFFDPEDRFAASVEALARFAADEAAGSAGLAPLVALFRAHCDRSWESVRECFAPDLILVDHRPLSLGTLDREQWIASIQAGDELADGVALEVFRALAWSEQGLVVAVRRFGTIAGGGGPFEVDALLTAIVVDGRFQRCELFGEADAECAVARFAELCAEHA